MTGYMHPMYTESISEFGDPRELPRCRGWVLERQIPGTPYHDAMGCYPLFFCQDWSKLHLDLKDMGTDLVTLSLVTDPFGAYDKTYLQQCFDIVIPFKEHFITDLHRPLSDIASKNRRKKARRALKEIRIEVCYEPKQFLDEWIALYNVLVEKHNIQGIRAFSETAFAKQLSIPGMIMLRAVNQGVTVGASLNVIQGDRMYGHLAAFSELGYKLGASYALDFFTIEFFSHKMHWFDLGAAAGLDDNDTDGLSLYKRGWSTDTRTVYFCGRVLDQKRYSQIIMEREIPTTTYFPAYRKGEFA